MSNRSTTRKWNPGVRTTRSRPRRPQYGHPSTTRPPTRARAGSWSLRQRRALRLRACGQWQRRRLPEFETTRDACDVARGPRDCTGRKVPAPTCSVTNVWATPLRGQRGKQRMVEVQARRRGGNCAGLARIDGLVPVGVGRAVADRSMYGGSGTSPCWSSQASSGRYRRKAQDEKSLRRAPALSARCAAGQLPAVRRPSADGSRAVAPTPRCRRRFVRAEVSTLPPVDFRADAGLDHAGVVEYQQIFGIAAATAAPQV